jgi:uncharacterized protein YukE/uncharacterized protein YqgC (DUF456 family)
MGLIGADTDLLRAAIAAMRQGGDVIEQAFNQANQAMQSLQSNGWAGQHRQQAEELWDRLQPRFASTIAALHQLTTRTERYTNALEEAGRVFGDGGLIGSSIGSSHEFDEDKRSPNVQSSNNVSFLGLGFQADNAKRFIIVSPGVIEKLKDVSETVKHIQNIASLKLRAGSYYVDQVIIKGSREVRKSLFINPFTNHFKVTPKSIYNQRLTGTISVTKGSILSTALFSIAEYGFENYKTYKDDKQLWQKTASATLFDTITKTAVVGVSTTAGAWIGGAVGTGIGTAIGGPVGAVIGNAVGVHVGGVLGGMVGEWVADRGMEQPHYEGAKKGFVQWMTDKIDEGIEVTRRGYGNTTNLIKSYIGGFLDLIGT